MVQHGAALVREGGDAALTEAVASAELDVLPQRLRALCAYALKLTVTPWAVAEDDLRPLRMSIASRTDSGSSWKMTGRQSCGSAGDTGSVA